MSAPTHLRSDHPSDAPAYQPVEAVKLSNTHRPLKVFLVEEQELLREAYYSLLLSHPGIELVGSSPHATAESLEAAVALGPEVLVMGTRSLQTSTVEQLDLLRKSAPHMGLVVLSFSYDLTGIGALRELFHRASAGCAYLLKSTIDSIEQLAHVIRSVAQGRTIMDPGAMDELAMASEPKWNGLRSLSPRELEVLGWMAKGFRNGTIAETLHLEPKTVERHINNIYSKLSSTTSNSMHPRSQAITLFLSASAYAPSAFTAPNEPDSMLHGAPNARRQKA